MMKTARYAFGSMFLAALVILIGCGSAGDSGLFGKSPGDIVTATYMAANADQYSEAEKHLSSEVLNAMKGGLGALAGGTKGMWDKMTGDRRSTGSRFTAKKSAERALRFSSRSNSKMARPRMKMNL